LLVDVTRKGSSHIGDTGSISLTTKTGVSVLRIERLRTKGGAKKFIRL